MRPGARVEGPEVTGGVVRVQVLPLAPDEGIGVGDRVAAVRLRVDPEDLAEQAVLRLGVPLRVALRAAVAGPEVEVSVGAELDGAAVVAARLVVADLDDLATGA